MAEELDRLAARYRDLVRAVDAGTADGSAAYQELLGLSVRDGAGLVWGLDLTSEPDAVAFCVVDPADPRSRGPADPTHFVPVATRPAPSAEGDGPIPSPGHTPGPSPEAIVAVGTPVTPPGHTPGPPPHPILSPPFPGPYSLEPSGSTAPDQGSPAPVNPEGRTSRLDALRGLLGGLLGRRVSEPETLFSDAPSRPGWSPRRRLAAVVVGCVAFLVGFHALVGSDQAPSRAKTTFSYSCASAAAPADEYAAAAGCLDTLTPGLMTRLGPAPEASVTRARFAAVIGAVLRSRGLTTPPSSTAAPTPNLDSLPADLRPDAQLAYAAEYVGASDDPAGPLSRRAAVWAVDRLWSAVAPTRPLAAGPRALDGAAGHGATDAQARLASAGLIDSVPGERFGFSESIDVRSAAIWLGRVIFFSEHPTRRLPASGAKWAPPASGRR